MSSIATNKRMVFDGGQSVETGVNVIAVTPTELYVRATVIVEDSGTSIMAVVSQNESEDSIFELRVSSNKASFAIVTESGTFTPVTDSVNIPFGVPVKLRGAWDGSTMKLFVDDVEKASTAISSIETTNVNNLVTIGRRPDESQFFTGIIYDVGVETDAGVLINVNGYDNVDAGWRDITNSTQYTVVGSPEATYI
tara:strand:+ start:1081 stop:1665 length:585 start_codon:yes stop_codon:yes gene_type:complete